MSDQRNKPTGPGANPWMRPLGSQQLIRKDPTRRTAAPAGPYTPNEPDHNEAIYAARAAAARQQVAVRQTTADPVLQSPVQQAVEQAAQQAHAARQSSYPQGMDRYAYAQPPEQPAAVLYQQSTGVQQPVQPVAEQTVQPAQPHRMPMGAYGFQMPQTSQQPPMQQLSYAYQPVAQGYAASISRQVDAAALADPMLTEEAAQPASPRRRSRMVMRQEVAEAEPVVASLPEEQPAPAAQPVPPPQEENNPFLRMESPYQREEIPPMPVEEPFATDSRNIPADPAPVEGAPDWQPDPLPDIEPIAPGDETFLTEDDAFLPEVPDQPALDPAALPADFFDLPLENPLKDFEWYTGEADTGNTDGDPAEDDMDTGSMPAPAPLSTLDMPKVDLTSIDQHAEDTDDEEPEEDCMDTSSMPTPAPVSTLEPIPAAAPIPAIHIPKVKRGRNLFVLLLVLMLLVAAVAFLRLSGYGERLYDGAIRVGENIQRPTISTGPMTVTPDTAALPATITVTLLTDDTISDLRLVDDSDQRLPVTITTTQQGKETLWTCTLTIDTPYNGFLHAQVLCKDGRWRLSNQKQHVEVN